MARKKKEECPSVPAWLISFSDLMSLLLTFFILLYSMSVLDIKKLMKFLWYFQGEKVLQYTKTVSLLPPISMLPKDMALNLKERIKKVLPVHAYQIEVIEDYVLLRLFNDVIFEKNSAQLSEEAKKALRSIAVALKALSKNEIEIRVEGHTDITPPKGVDPWELSVKRAVNVAQFLINNGVDPKKISATGYGNTKPIYTWNHPLLRRRNNRVEIIIKVKMERKDLEKKKINLQ
ncbi:flagellar motor protein MotB [Persephonella atlantica]|uniref:Flagellar motor protein MotB n=1 Tax=Persephonella atlantica TaxID=2699429 RepID=A0ABS1GJQ3_9AQUI|nr:flagellar motor protein MotB [Persephonella atlantica]MBK3333151.1 flagellar motor protein MotB [Persephonella atlantica]